MNQRPSELERAFELAKSGKCATIDGIRKQLRAERYTGDQLSGKTLMTQLRGMIKTARGAARQGKA